MFKRIPLVLVACLMWASLALALATPVQQGGVCVNCVTGGGGIATPVNTTGVTTNLVSANVRRTSVTLYCSNQINIEPGDTAGTAPTIAPTTGAMGTGIGFVIPATTMVTFSGGALQAPSSGGIALNLPPGDRIDAIASSANGFCATWEQFN